MQYVGLPVVTVGVSPVCELSLNWCIVDCMNWVLYDSRRAVNCRRVRTLVAHLITRLQTWRDETPPTVIPTSV